VILPLAIILVWFGLSRGLAPLHALQSNIRARRPDDLSPLEAGQAPPEIAPLVASFNDLLTRLEQNMEFQKRFIADAAHQMKTPLAGLRTQAELVQRSLEQIATSSEHAARLVTQLLALARAENRATGQIFSRVELTDLARLAVRDWVQAALSKQMDIGYEEPPHPVEVEGNVVMLREMLSNLIDNAIRYTPPGGRITVRVRTDEKNLDLVHLEVEDTGLGIPAAERQRAIEDHVYQEAPRLAGTLVRVSLQRVYPARDKP
jgi:two-component system sensor histidine kinase TctE